ncbi:hypothetical protein L596_010955 [Steinernema carpocapsae]|uniref:Uncharacterized protein n=1 Tax=Steinernema carpocapsae TaxID=34508 RepID=A0A4U5NSM3_STECR|nr:hypothetical protein L596_010955 [Steinernema carpocapsae]
MQALFQLLEKEVSIVCRTKMSDSSVSLFRNAWKKLKKLPVSRPRFDRRKKFLLLRALEELKLFHAVARSRFYLLWNHVFALLPSRSCLKCALLSSESTLAAAFSTE